MSPSIRVIISCGRRASIAPATINLMTTYPDKAQMRNILAYETYRDAGCAYHWVFPVRVQQNGAFWGTAHVMENGDKDWLIRMGLNVDGALYKMYNTFTNSTDATVGAEKKTRKSENNADLLALFNGINLAGDACRRYLYDNVDVAEVVDFLAARTLTGDIDCCHKNYYFYRDTGRSNEWQMWPWDVDLSFGRVWSSGLTYWDQTLHADTPLFVGGNNRLPFDIFNTPEMRQMYLRRFRTLIDELLESSPMATQPNSSPTPTLRPQGVAPEAPVVAATANAGQQLYEPRIDELAAQIAPDAAWDNAKWNSNAWGNGSTAPNYPQSYADAVAELRNFYLPQRRRQLFNRLVSGASEIPDSQPNVTVVMFGAIEASPSRGNQDEQYIQLLNANSFAVDISGWSLTMGLGPQDPALHLPGRHSHSRRRYALRGGQPPRFPRPPPRAHGRPSPVRGRRLHRPAPRSGWHARTDGPARRDGRFDLSLSHSWHVRSTAFRRERPVRPA